MGQDGLLSWSITEGNKHFNTSLKKQTKTTKKQERLGRSATGDELLDDQHLRFQPNQLEHLGRLSDQGSFSKVNWTHERQPLPFVEAKRLYRQHLALQWLLDVIDYVCSIKRMKHQSAVLLLL